MNGVDFVNVSRRAKERGAPQLGTLGAGNHFIELQKVSRIYDMHIAKVFGIHSTDQILIMIHCGSRGLGHQIASDYIRLMENKFGFKGLPDRELIHAPIQSQLGRQYYQAMGAAVNYAFANRQIIANLVRTAFNNIMGTSAGMDQVFDVCHNVAKFEQHNIDGQTVKVCIHRKGATRSFGAGRDEIPELYRPVGQPVIIPGSMGTSSFLLVGTLEAEELSFGSTAHGAGRMMSRKKALQRFDGKTIKQELASRGIELQSSSLKGVAEEASQAYKNVDEVVAVSQAAGIGKLVAKLVPVGVIKG